MHAVSRREHDPVTGDERLAAIQGKNVTFLQRLQCDVLRLVARGFIQRQRQQHAATGDAGQQRFLLCGVARQKQRGDAHQ